MKSSISGITLFCLFFPGFALAQSGAVIPEGGAGHANQASCVILKRMGPADEVTSRLYAFGIRGKQFQYVEGKLPEGFPFHGRLTDHDVRNLQDRGAEVLMLEPHYTAEDLKGAREQCEGMTGANPNHLPAADQHAPQRAVTQVVSTDAPATPLQSSASSQVSITVDSTPEGADIEVDGAFVGNTPSTVVVPVGMHDIAISKNGFASWTRKLNVAGGNIGLKAELKQTIGE